MSAVSASEEQSPFLMAAVRLGTTVSAVMPTVYATPLTRCNLFCNRTLIQMLYWAPVPAPATRLARRQWASAIMVSTRIPVGVSGVNCVSIPSVNAGPK